MLKQLITLFLGVIACVIPVSASRQHGFYPSWTLHSSFDNLPRRIFDAPDKVYFFVHQRIFDTGNKFYATYEPRYIIPTGAVFILDKANPQRPMADLHQLASLSGTDISALEIDPQTGVMVIGYADGGIDVVKPAGDSYKVTYFTDIKKRTFPGDAKINNISFNPSGKIVRVSCGSGFVEISIDTPVVTASTSWGVPVNDINNFGDRHVAIINGKVCATSVGAPMRRQNSYEAVDCVNSLLPGTDAQRIMPLSDNHFAVLAENGRIVLATLTNGEWAAELKFNDSSIPQTDAATTVCNKVDHTVTITDKGYYISSTTNAYLINRPESAGQDPVLKSQSLPSGSTRYSSSFDGNTFWFYRDRGQFQSAVWSDNWSPLSEPVRPLAPLSCEDAIFDYSPTQGLVMTTALGGRYSITYSHNPDTYNIMRQPALLCTFKNGSWHNVAPVYHTPDAALSNSQMLTDYKNLCNANSFPLADPNSMVVDPLFPDFVHLGSMYTGAATCNLANPNELPLLTVPNNNAFGAHGFAFDTFTENSGNERILSIAGVDADGTLWGFRMNPWGDAYNSTHAAYFYYLTKEDREHILTQGNSSGLKWRRFTGQIRSWGNKRVNSWILKHPKNNHKIASTYEEAFIARHLGIYDHKGTPDDTSDDTYDVISKVSTSDGTHDINYVNRVLEDPFTGDVIVLGNFVTAIIDLDNPVDDNFTIKGRLLESLDGSGGQAAFDGSMQPAEGCIDEYGRLWLAMQTNGVIGYDLRDRSIIAHYTPENSPLPSNKTYAVGWNPDTKSLFISTANGIAEVKPDAPMAFSDDVPSYQQPYLTPSEVSADFEGLIAVHNAPEAVNLSVLDMDGNVMAVLPAPVSGLTQWDLLTADGRRAPRGLYKVCDQGGYSEFPELFIVVK